MTLSEALLVAGASYLSIALRAAQQINVTKDIPSRVPIVSLGLAIMDVTVIIRSVEHGWSAVIPLWLGGTLGCLTTMALYRRSQEKPLDSA